GPTIFAAKPDPLLDAPLSFTWLLPLREGWPRRQYRLNGNEVMAALSREIHRPLIVDGLPQWLNQEQSLGPKFRWENRSVRELLTRFFPSDQGQVRDGAIFLWVPQRVKWALNQL